MTVSVSKPAPNTAQGAPLLSARKQLDVITAYRQVGTYRGAAEMCGLTHKTVKRIIERVEAAEDRVARRKNYESVRSLVAHEISETKGKISAKRLLPKAHAAGYAGSARNFRRLVAQERAKYRQHQAIARARRPGVWTPGEHLVIDWGVLERAARVLRRAGLVPGAVRALRRPTSAPSTTLRVVGRVLRGPRWGPEGRARRPDGVSEGRGRC